MSKRVGRRPPTAGEVSCPCCGRTQPRRQENSIYWCDHCLGQFDGKPEEGGDYFTDPTKRLEIQERRSRRPR